MKKRSMMFMVVGMAAVCMAGGWALQPEKTLKDRVIKETDKVKEKAKETVKDAGHGAQPGDPAGMDPKMMEMMKKMEEAGTPGEMHKLLGEQVGEWDYVTTFRMDPSQPEGSGKGHAKFRSLYDGRYIEADMNGNMQTPMGEMPFNGRATMGYNNTTKKFEGTWIDAMSTQTMFGTGTYDAAKHQFTMVYEGTNCMTGKPCKMTEVTTHTDKDHFTSEFTMPDMNGKDFKGMVIKYTRKGASEAHAPATPAAPKAPAAKPSR